MPFMPDVGVAFRRGRTRSCLASASLLCDDVRNLMTLSEPARVALPPSQMTRIAAIAGEMSLHVVFNVPTCRCLACETPTLSSCPPAEAELYIRNRWGWGDADVLRPKFHHLHLPFSIFSTPPPPKQPQPLTLLTVVDIFTLLVH